MVKVLGRKYNPIKKILGGVGLIGGHLAVLGMDLGYLPWLESSGSIGSIVALLMTLFGVLFLYEGLKEVS